MLFHTNQNCIQLIKSYFKAYIIIQEPKMGGYGRGGCLKATPPVKLSHKATLLPQAFFDRTPEIFEKFMHVHNFQVFLK